MSTSNSSTPPGTSTKPKTSRMRTMARRTSSMLSFGRASGSQHKTDASSEASSSRRPSLDLDTPPNASSSSSSLTVETAIPDHVAKEHLMPSPIPESPAREAAANAEEAQVVGRARAPKTSLHQVVTAMNEALSPPPAPQAEVPAAPASTKPEPEPEPEAESKSPPSPAPVIVTDPAKFTTEPDSMSLSSARSRSQSVSMSQSHSDHTTGKPASNQSTSKPASQTHVPPEINEPPPLQSDGKHSDSYFEVTPRPAVESFHAQSDPEDLRRLKKEIVRNTIGEIPSEGEHESRGDAKAEEVVTPRPHGPGDMENVNVYIATPAPVPASASVPAPKAAPAPVSASVPATSASAPIGSKPAERAIVAQPVPASSVKPVQPGRETQPVQPTQLVKPAQPAPAQPTQPVQHGQPTQPARAVQPVQPAQPIQPVQPARAVQPVQPSQSPPAQPIQPARAVQPVGVHQPVQPSQPPPAQPAPAMPVPVPATASPAAPVEVAATVTAEVTTKKETATASLTAMPEAVVMPGVMSDVKKEEDTGAKVEVIEDEPRHEDNLNDRANDNEDPFADPVIPIQISAQPSFEQGQESNITQPQPISPQAPTAFTQAPSQVVYMPLPPFQDVSGTGGGKFVPMRGYDYDRPTGETRSLLPQGYDNEGYGFGYGATGNPSPGMVPHHPQPRHHQPHQAGIPSYMYTQGPGNNIGMGLGTNNLNTSSTLTSSSDVHIPHPINTNANTVTFPKLLTPSSQSQSQAHAHTHTHSHKSTLHSSALPRLQRLGWTAYTLPNPENTVYYVHPRLRITTDVDLGSLRELDEVMKYLEMRRIGEGMLEDGDGQRQGGAPGGLDEYGDMDVGVPQGYELWLINNPEAENQRDLNQGMVVVKGKRKKRPAARGEFQPLRCWVDHRKCLASFDPIWDARVDGVSRSVPRRGERNHGHGMGMGRTDDALDMEYRYWAFLESHPAHVTLAPKAQADAIELLEWASTDQFIAPYQNQAHGAFVRPPFTPTECQELLKWLKAFGDKPEASSAHTRVVARIFMRVLLWRQMHLRPHKPLPQDIPKPAYLTYLSQQAQYRTPSFFRTLLDVIVSIVFLGIPYMLYTRAVYAQRMDAEYGLGGVGLRAMGMRDAGPLMLIGGCTCLVAAIVLSASVTFLSLPGLDTISRIVGFVAITLAGFSMVSTVLALFSYKAEMERTSVYVGGEGLMVHSRRIIMLSVPLAFCIYSIVAFVAGIALYSFRGMQAQVPQGLIENHFANYTQWKTLGALGGLGGVIVVATAVLLG